MNTVKIIELLSYTIPSLITGGIAYYFFNLHITNEDNRRYYLLRKESQKQALPLRLQAYERMTLYLERINPNKLLFRSTAIGTDKNDYENLIINQIEQEFEHNLSQQIYISDKCWAIISTAKNATIQMIRKASMNEKVTNASELRDALLNELINKQAPSHIALSFIKNEVGNLW